MIKISINHIDHIHDADDSDMDLLSQALGSCDDISHVVTELAAESIMEEIDSKFKKMLEYEE